MDKNTNNENMDTRRFICTVDDTTFAGKKALVNARNSAVSLNSFGTGKPFSVVGAYTAPGIRAQSGTPCTNVYLFAADGTTYFTQSEGINRSVLDIAGLFPDFNAADGGIPVVVKATELDGGKTIKSLEIQ